jgi:large subunit ribosomal protein L1
MAKISKRWAAIQSKIQLGKIYPVTDALQLLKECATAKFDEGVDVSINLGVDVRKSEQTVRGALLLPNGTGRQVRVAVFAQGKAAENAQSAGADRVGFEDLAEAIKGGDLNFDVVIATPDAMRIVGTLGQILGPRGLMPNPKVGTVTQDVINAVKNAKGGQVRYRTDKAGIVHCTIGNISFQPKALQENLEALITDLKKSKPSAAKGIYLKKVTISSTMGPGLIIDQFSLNV